MVVFRSDKNVGVERSNFLAPSLRVRFAVLMHHGRHRLIEERQLVILDIDHLKPRILAAFQNVVCPFCDGRGFPSRSRTTDDDSNFQHLLFLPSGAFFRYSWCLELYDHFLTCFLLLLTLPSWWLSFSAASSPSFLSDSYSCSFSSWDRADMSASRSFACRSKHDTASRLPCAVSSTTRARRSLGLDLRTTKPSFSRRSTAAVIDPLARRTLSWISEIVSGPLCRRASSATKSVRHSPVLAMLCSASRLSAR